METLKGGFEKIKHASPESKSIPSGMTENPTIILTNLKYLKTKKQTENKNKITLPKK